MLSTLFSIGLLIDGAVAEKLIYRRGESMMLNRLLAYYSLLKFKKKLIGQKWMSALTKI